MFGRLALAVTAVIAFASASVSAQEIVLAVNEGVTYHEGGSVSERYKPLTELLSKELKRPVKVQNVDKYTDFDKGLSEGKYDLAFIHPAHIGLRAVKSGAYSGLATAKGFTDYRARVMVKKDSPLRSMQDLKDRKIGVPSVDSITTVMFSASLREARIQHPERQFLPTRYQDAVPFMIENGFVDAGVTGSNAVEKDWIAKGGRVLTETKPIPIKQFLASKKLSDAERAKLQTLILSLSDSDAGKTVLSKIGVPGFVPWNNEVMNQATTRLGI
ncbi:phosphate/phosphite/phosphonate ABC transporter substrate-binding protein [Oxalobacteraceae bacterium R-40]|uniref:Phosphate/phosphite/phosphonate ABC transporter substrate-binding protein n=1 Tax=Keguizhuia sedimenti TaxID=3064264 RepID=A0ABU1BVD7_9BURK|nr:phosphate/phosphite/phosphonate ABC transporter substrate-binding protein [Oxalobacteraceae bacterium R-40]